MTPAPNPTNPATGDWDVTLTGGPATLRVTADGFITIAGATRALADVSAIRITGTDGDDVLVLDLATPLAIPVSFDGGPGTDTLVGPSRDVTWLVGNPDSGTVAGVAFVSVEHLTGAPDNRDTFVFGPGGSVSGLVDGGARGFDTMVIDGGGSAVIATVTGPQTGTISRGSDVLAYTGLEPVEVTGTTTVMVNAPDAATVSLADSGTTADGTFVIDFNGGGETHTITNAGSVTDLTINLGGGPNEVTLHALDPAFNGNLTVVGGTGDDAVVFEARTGGGTYTFSGGDGADSVSAERDGGFALSDTQLTAGPDVLLLADVERATLTGGDGDNTFTIGEFSGSANLEGLAGDDSYVFGADEMGTSSSTSTPVASTPSTCRPGTAWRSTSRGSTPSRSTRT